MVACRKQVAKSSNSCLSVVRFQNCMCSESCAWLAATMFGSCICEGCLQGRKQPSHVQLPNMVAASQAQLSLHMQFWNRTTDKQLLKKAGCCEQY
jgi:hypothetical protein